MRAYVPLALLASAALAVAAFIGQGGMGKAVTALAATVCLACPAGALIAVNAPLLRAAKRSLRRGAMLTGWRAVKDFGHVHALAVDALELFPSESVLLHGIKTFSGTRIDEAIMDAAAVSISAGGPLSSVFRRVIEDKVDILQEVDTLVYEQDMGLSGWVGGRRVLVGNRRLLENHGVDVPSRDYESRYAKEERKLVYLSIAGELSAMFVISYLGDESIGKAVRMLGKEGITLLVRTCDPNITEELICDAFGLDSYYLEVMGAAAGRAYDRLIKEETGEEEAVLASNGRLEGMAAALAYCRRLRTGTYLAVATQLIGGVLGLALNAFLILYTGHPLPSLYAAGYLAGWTLLCWLMPLFRRV